MSSTTIHRTNTFPALQSPRFYLRQVLQEDIPFLFEGLGDPVSMPYNGVYYTTVEETKKQLEWYDKNQSDGSGVAWKIVDKNTGERVGVISFFHHKPEHKKAELGFWLLPRFWNRGITSEVMDPVIQYCIQARGMHRLEAFVESENLASARVLEKKGFVKEGTMQDCEIKFGRYISLMIYALLSPAQQPS